jgi:hypothetical protein
MRKEYDFSKAIGNPYAARIRATARKRAAENDDGFALSPALKRELARRARDSDDRARYLIANVVLPRFVLYYDVSDDVYAMNAPHATTLFKRQATARAVLQQLGGRCRVVPCRVNRKGRLVKSSVALKQSVKRRGVG